MENKELFLEKLNNINQDTYDIKISKSVDYSHVPTIIGEPIKTIIHISIISGYFAATISSNNKASFSVFDKDDVFKCQNYGLEYADLFKEAYNILKPLLSIEV